MTVTVGASAALYDALAPTYDEHFGVPHRRAYDDLAWELVRRLLPAGPGRVVDVGCGVGRWARRFVDLGHAVVGIEPAPAMAALAREHLASARFELVEQVMEEVHLPAGQADLVLAMGSLQYAEEPEQVLPRLARWVRPGGAVAVLVDSLVALVLELMSAGRPAEALERLETRQGTWVQDGRRADLHLFDAQRLRAGFGRAGLTGVEIRGLLVGWSMLGRERTIARLTADRDGYLALERRLGASSVLTDLGKQLYAVGRVPPADGAGRDERLSGPRGREAVPGATLRNEIV
jgi:SAM-dependent methyltransferase